MIKIFIVLAVMSYFAGIFTGFYAAHPLSSEWYNPDAFVHSSLFMIVIVWLGEKFRNHRTGKQEDMHNG